jgi:hypothetical protein
MLSYYLELNYYEKYENGKLSVTVARDYATRIELLKAIPNLGLNCVGAPGIHGGSDKEYPSLKISWDDVECVVYYSATEVLPDLTRPWTFGDTGSRSNGFPQYIQNPFGGYELHIFNQNKASEGTGIVNNKLNDTLQEFFKPNYGSDELLFVIKEGLSLVPYVGYTMPVFDAIEFGIERKENNMASQYTATMLEQSTLFGELYGPLGCDAVITYGTENPNSISVSVYQGLATDGILSRLNETLINKGAEIPQDVKLPIDFSTVMSNPEEVHQLVSELSGSETNYVIYNLMSKGGIVE